MPLTPDMPTIESRIQFYATAAYPCSYLAEREARSQVATPPQQIDSSHYSTLIQHGFRRSGAFIYRPYCDTCQDCIPVRLPVAELTPSRSQKRAWQRHGGLQAQECELAFSEAHFALYVRYQQARHQGGGMDEDDREQYAQFLLQSRVDTRLVEFHDNGELRMVSLIDVVDDGLSSVYTFFEPDAPQSSYGVYNILWQAARCRALGLPYLYLGYWIANSPKMAYKKNYQPIEGYINGQWQPLPINETP